MSLEININKLPYFELFNQQWQRRNLRGSAAKFSDRNVSVIINKRIINIPSLEGKPLCYHSLGYKARFVYIYISIYERFYIFIYARTVAKTLPYKIMYTYDESNYSILGVLLSHFCETGF